MSQRGRSAILKLAKAIIRGNDASVPVRKRTKGGLVERGAACQRMQDLICTIKMKGDGREYVPNPNLNSVLGDLRQQAGDLRLSAGIRAKAIIALAVAENFLPDTELGDSVTSTYLKSLLAIAPEKSEAKPVAIDFKAMLAEIDKKLAVANGGEE